MEVLMKYNMMSLEDQLIDHEGLELKPYQCTAEKLTIGVGRNIEDRGITEDEARYLLKNDIKIVEDELLEKKPVVGGLDSVRQRVLVDMGFNLGTPTLLKFENMWAAIEDEDWIEAGEQMKDSRWARQVGRRADRLIEAMQTGEWV
jgi:lysozyme|tara:strand:- start:481 stop:918 length:438 start_codon:yes stop_codon:yes gene_type:complete